MVEIKETKMDRITFKFDMDQLIVINFKVAIKIDEIFSDKNNIVVSGLICSMPELNDNGKYDVVVTESRCIFNPIIQTLSYWDMDVINYIEKKGEENGN